jgi:hexosaminidase
MKKFVHCLFKQILKTLLVVLSFLITQTSIGQTKTVGGNFSVRGFHIDLRIQVMTMPALKQFASKLKTQGINTLIMEWEATYPFTKYPFISNRYAYTKDEVHSFIRYCAGIGLDVIPLQQSFGHVEYILRHQRFKDLREDQKDYSQVCPLKTEADSILFTDLYSELSISHPSKYMHIGGDETYLLGHDDRCKQKALVSGKSVLYIDYIKMICNIVIKLGKRPILWADIALHYPEAIADLPRETVFVDWNYGWDLNRFGNHQALLDSGFEIWGAPSLRSWPDNYYLTSWEKHFNNIKDFIPLSARLGYKGIVMTSWSTSGLYSSRFESDSELVELYPVRHVYPLNGFNILVDAFTSALTADTFSVEKFIFRYCNDRFGFDENQSKRLLRALYIPPFQINGGEVVAPDSLSIQQLIDANQEAITILYNLKPKKNKREFEHFKLMSAIRDYYLRFQLIQKEINDFGFERTKSPALVQRLKALLMISKKLDHRFAKANRGFLNPSEIEEENQIRNMSVKNLYTRLSGKK